MKILDVNVLAFAHHPESKDHLWWRDWLQALLDSDAVLGIPEVVFCNVIRVVTLPHWGRPSTTVEALEFCEALRAHARGYVLQPSERHWPIFERICRRAGAKGNLINDAYLAAFAIDLDAEFVTGDRDFGKFPGLTWRLLPENRRRTNPR